MPNNINDLCHFLSLVAYFRKFVPLFVDITKPLNELLKKDTKFQWSPKCQAAVKHLKKVLCKKPILQYPNREKSYTLFTDISHYAYSGVLTQAVDSPEDLRPTAHTSGSFSDMQQKWSVTEKEDFGVYQSILKFDLYLIGVECILCCNHKQLEPFLYRGIKISMLNR